MLPFKESGNFFTITMFYIYLNIKCRSMMTGKFRYIAIVNINIDVIQIEGIRDMIFICHI
nr:hypothetical protein [Cronobacter dublinensis]